MQQERTKLESMTVARKEKDKVRAGIIDRHESKRPEKQKLLLERKGHGHRQRQLPEQKTEEQLPGQERIMSEAFRIAARTGKDKVRGKDSCQTGKN